MCGIAGIIYKSKKPVSPESLEIMKTSLSHRGPDDSGIALWQNVGLANTRLSIVDITSAGHQPMTFQSYTITYNGEVYNYQNLKDKLANKGHSFNSSSDTEVLLHAYAEWGIEGIRLAEGMFAAAILDTDRNELVLVRDRVGIKPLYYYDDPVQFIFASEIKAIKNLPGVNLSINAGIVSSYFSLLYTPACNTPFREIKKLKPGNYLKINLNSFQVFQAPYWHLENSKTGAGKEEVNLQQLIMDSIGKQLRADVPVGLWLSGGLDSGMIATIAAKELDKKLDVFTIRFINGKTYLDESEIAKSLANRLGHNFHFIEIDQEKLFDSFDEVLEKQEEWVANPSAFLAYHLAQKTKEHLPVVLSGIGGDELFGGYNRYRALQFSQKLKVVPSAIRNGLLTSLSFFSQSRQSRTGNFNRALMKTIRSVEDNDYDTYRNLIQYLDKEVDETIQFERNGDLMNDVMRYDLQHYLVDDILLLTDKMSMAHGLEVRVPYLDHKVVDYAFAMNSTKRMGKAGSKRFLRDWFNELAGNENRNVKKGFTAPVEGYLKKLGQEYFTNLFAKANLKEFLNKEIQEQVISGFFMKQMDYSNQLYSMLVFCKWRLINNF